MVPPERRGGRREARHRQRARPLRWRSRETARGVRPQPLRRGQAGAALARIRAPVPRSDADRPAGRRHRQHLPDQGVRDGDPDRLPDPVQRRSRPPAGGQGGRSGRGASEDDDHQGPRPPGREPGRGSGGTARPRRHRQARGGRCRSRRRAPPVRRHARDRRVGAHRGEPAGLEGRRDDRNAGRAARRPDGHGLHEHERHPRRGGLRRHRDGHADRGRAHLRPPAARGGREDAAHAAARQAHEADPRPRRALARHLRSPQPLPRELLQHGVHGRDRLRDRRDPDRASRRGHDDPLVRDADAGEGERDREAAALDRDARLDLGDQLRQDRNAHAQPDDGGRDDDPGQAVRDLGQRLLDRGDDQAGRGAGRRAARPVPDADGARVGCRGHRRRRDDRRPDRGRARRARREGRLRRGGDPPRVPARRRVAVRHRVQADGHLPPDEG